MTNFTVFGDRNPLGAKIRVRNLSFRVIGVMVEKGAAMGINQDEALFIPISVMASQVAGEDNARASPTLQSIAISASSAERMSAAQYQITNLLRLRHNIKGENDFTVRSQQELLQSAESVTGILVLLLAATSGISLLVGGIGIMNIMLVSVTERTHEIGLRKALGATRSDIQIQFTVEAIILAVTGGSIGIAIAVSSTVILSALTPLQADDLIYAEIEERRQKPDPERTDILSLLLSARDEAGQAMTNKELRDQLVTILFVGHENSATGIAWALYWVHKQPEVLHKLLQELESLGESPDAMSIARLPYLTAACNETLRMASVNMLLSGRMVQSPVELMGYQLSPGTAIFGSIYLTHRREDLYPEPKQFKPERFLERQFSPYEFLPFGGGNRSCIGANLAVLKIKLALATILSRYKLALSDNRPERLQGRGVVLVPANGVKMIIQSQRTSQDRAIAASASIN